LHQSFKEATTPPQALPPQMTITKKSVGKLYSEVVKQWPEIRFVSPDGKKLVYKATLDTTFGTIELDLWPEIAPNHVRNFVALARAGYYDGLFFEDIIGSLDGDKDLPRAVTAGSPEGDASELSSIGYWLQPEILKPEVAKEKGINHQPGTVGACHAYQQPNTASCRFYIMLGDAPAWDGEYTIFGQVTHGLDVVQKIFEHPQRAGDDVEPMRINKVTILVRGEW
jgi:cyclophilin family peptidyl-prolyl cis-trans isomerase